MKKYFCIPFFALSVSFASSSITYPLQQLTTINKISSPTIQSVQYSANVIVESGNLSVTQAGKDPNYNYFYLQPGAYTNLGGAIGMQVWIFGKDENGKSFYCGTQYEQYGAVQYIPINFKMNGYDLDLTSSQNSIPLYENSDTTPCAQLPVLDYSLSGSSSSPLGYQLTLTAPSGN